MFFGSVKNCHNTKDFRNLAKKNYLAQYFIILMVVQMMKLLKTEILQLTMTVT